MSVAKAILTASQTLSATLEQLTIGEPVTHVYNPLVYAWKPYQQFVERFGNSPKRVVFLGINPGPWGMAQTGVPFGEIAAVRDWMGIHAEVGQPPNAHPSKPVMGFGCQRSEVSGKRLWGLMQARFGEPEAFFEKHYVINYCPLLLTNGRNGKARNLTPDKLKAAERAPIFTACDEHLKACIAALRPQWLVGVGNFALERAQGLFADTGIQLGKVLHPAPANPQANRGWAEQATRQLVEQGIWAE